MAWKLRESSNLTINAEIKAPAHKFSHFYLLYAWFVFSLNPWYSINEFAERVIFFERNQDKSSNKFFRRNYSKLDAVSERIAEDNFIAGEWRQINKLLSFFQIFELPSLTQVQFS